MASESRQLYQMFIKKGMQKEDAFFAVFDHFNEQHWFDRNRYHVPSDGLNAAQSVFPSPS